MQTKENSQHANIKQIILYAKKTKKKQYKVEKMFEYCLLCIRVGGWV